MFHTINPIIFSNYNFIADWAGAKICTWSNEESPHYNMIKARVMAVVLPIFMGLQLVQELVLSAPRVILFSVTCVVLSTKWVYHVVRGQESVQEKEALFEISSKMWKAAVRITLFSIFWSSSLGGVLDPETYMKFCESLGLISKPTFLSHSSTSMKWMYFERSQTSEDAVLAVTHLIEYNAQAFYRELYEGGYLCRWMDLLNWPKYSPCLKLMIEKTPELFLEHLLKEHAKEKLQGVYKIECNHPDEELQNEDSILDLIIKQYSSAEKSHELLSLFVETMPDFWMRQALQGSTPILCKYRKTELLAPLLQSYSYTQKRHQEWQKNQDTPFSAFLFEDLNAFIQSGEAIEVALLMQDSGLLNEIVQQMEEEPFKNSMQQLCQKYPAIKPQLLAIQEQVLTGFRRNYYKNWGDIKLNIENLSLQSTINELEWRKFDVNILSTIKRIALEKGLEENPKTFYEILLAKNNYGYTLWEEIIKRGHQSFLKLLIKKTSFRFVNQLLKSSYSKEYKEIQLEISLHQLLSNRSLDERYKKQDNLLLLILRQYPTPKRSTLFLQLFEEYLPDLWMRQALQQRFSILQKFHQQKYLLPILKAYPYTQQKHLEWEKVQSNLSFTAFFAQHLSDWIQSGEAIEIALLLKDDASLKQIAQQMGTAAFKKAMKQLRHKYPALNVHLIKKEELVIPPQLEIKYGSFQQFADIAIVFEN